MKMPPLRSSLGVEEETLLFSFDFFFLPFFLVVLADVEEEEVLVVLVVVEVDATGAAITALRTKAGARQDVLVPDLAPRATTPLHIP